MSKIQIRDIIYKKHIHAIVFYSALIIFSMLISLSIILYPKPFSIFITWISTLGDPRKNPIGCIPFNIGVFFIGGLLIIHYIYLIPRLNIKNPIFKAILVILFNMGAVGFMLISILTDNIQPYHDISAVFAFLGLGLGYLLLCPYYALGIIKRKYKSKKKVILFYIFFIEFLLFMALFIVIGIPNSVEFSDYIIWEWSGFFTLMFGITTIFIFTD